MRCQCVSSVSNRGFHVRRRLPGKGGQATPRHDDTSANPFALETSYDTSNLILLQFPSLALSMPYDSARSSRSRLLTLSRVAGQSQLSFLQMSSSQSSLLPAPCSQSILICLLFVFLVLPFVLNHGRFSSFAVWSTSRPGRFTIGRYL
jgi:hypothetical protein